jgi:hypothetical protein
MRYFLGFLITIGLIVLLVVLLFGGGGDKGKVPTTKTPLISYANTDTIVRETIDEKVNDVENHRQILITVGRDSTDFELHKGYDGDVLRSQSYPMTASSYASFLRSLQHAGFTEGNNDDSLKDERGYCPLGKRYIFEVIDSEKTIERFWATSCGNSTPKTFNGKLSTVLDLFQLQVPDYRALTRETEPDALFNL